MEESRNLEKVIFREPIRCQCTEVHPVFPAEDAKNICRCLMWGPPSSPSSDHGMHAKDPYQFQPLRPPTTTSPSARFLSMQKSSPQNMTFISRRTPPPSKSQTGRESRFTQKGSILTPSSKSPRRTCPSASTSTPRSASSSSEKELSPPQHSKSFL